MGGGSIGEVCVSACTVDYKGAKTTHVGGGVLVFQIDVRVRMCVCALRKGVNACPHKLQPYLAIILPCRSYEAAHPSANTSNSHFSFLLNLARGAHPP